MSYRPFRLKSRETGEYYKWSSEYDIEEPSSRKEATIFEDNDPDFFIEDGLFEVEFLAEDELLNRLPSGIAPRLPF